MRIEITGLKYDVGKNLEEILNKKIEKQLGRYFGDSNVARVVCKEEHGKYKMELTIIVGDTVLRAENANSNSMYDNVDVVIPKVERQMRKYRTKLSKKLRETQDLYQEPESEVKKEELVKRKKYALRPMSIEEAIFQLNVMDHSFYVFLNEETGEVNVVYRRDDGNIGLIETENE
jgi:putative sigma-54 modulation protein